MAISKEQKDTLAKVEKAIKDFGEAQKTEENKDFAHKVLESAGNAERAMADNEEKYATLLDSLTRWANQLAFVLFRDDLLTPELEAEYRDLPDVNETTAHAKSFADARQARIDEINAEQKDVETEIKGIEVFRAIISGMSADEAKQKMTEYEEELKKAEQAKKN